VQDPAGEMRFRCAHFTASTRPIKKGAERGAGNVSL
jgi:hypothetical protein